MNLTPAQRILIGIVAGLALINFAIGNPMIGFGLTLGAFAMAYLYTRPTH